MQRRDLLRSLFGLPLLPLAALAVPESVAMVPMKTAVLKAEPLKPARRIVYKCVYSDTFPLALPERASKSEDMIFTFTEGGQGYMEPVAT